MELTREHLEARLHRGVARTGEPSWGCQLSRKYFSNTRDSTGYAAHMLLQQLGYTVWGHQELFLPFDPEPGKPVRFDPSRPAGIGIAYTACGLILTSKGYAYRDWERADAYHAGKGSNLA